MRIMSAHEFYVGRRLARRAFYRQNGLCFWCQRPMILDGPQDDPLTMTADHVQALCDGGHTKPGNIVAACYECNQARGKLSNQERRIEQRLTTGDDTASSPFEILRKLL